MIVLMVTVHLPSQPHSLSGWQFLLPGSNSYQWGFPPFPLLPMQYQPFIDNRGKPSIFKTSTLKSNYLISTDNNLLKNSEYLKYLCNYFQKPKPEMDLLVCTLRPGYMCNSWENQIKENFPWVLSMVLYLRQTQKEATVCHPWHPWTSRKMLGFLYLSLLVFFVLFCFVFQTVQQVR